MRVIENAHMASYTSFRTGGHVEQLVFCDSADELVDLLDELDKRNKKYIFLGNGTNTLFTSGMHDCLVVMPGPAFDTVEISEELVTCGAGALLSSVAKKAFESSLTGLEFASGIPGSVGGAIYMNAGAYGNNISDVLAGAVVAAKSDQGRKLKLLTTDELDLGYRTSALQENGAIVVSAVFKLKKGDKDKIAKKMKELAEKRNTKQPLDLPSAGSFFKRPEGHYAGKLIEEAGLAGLSVGGAQVSPKHCGFIVNRGNASPEDILDLMRLVQYTVYDRSGIILEPEVRIIK